MAYLNNAIVMKAEFGRLCSEPWFGAITDQVVAQFGGHHIPEGGYETVARLIIWIAQQAREANQMAHPVMKDPEAIIKLIRALTADTRLQYDVANYLGGVLKEAGTIA